MVSKLMPRPKKVMNLGDLGAKFAAFDWEVIKLEKGNDINEVVKALEHARTFLGKGKYITAVDKHLGSKEKEIMSV